MKIVLAIAGFLLGTALGLGLAFAQQAKPTQEEMAASYYMETGQLRVALGQAQMQIMALRKELAETKAKAAPVVEPKSVPIPAPVIEPAK